MKVSLWWALGGIGYVLFTQLLALLFQKGVGPYWLIAWMTRGDVGGYGDAGTVVVYPVVWSGIGGTIDAIVFAVVVVMFACIGPRVKQGTVLYAGTLMMAVCSVAETFGVPVYLLVVADVSLLVLIGTLMWTVCVKQLARIDVPLQLYCMLVMFVVGTSCMRPFDWCDAQSGGVVWNYWVATTVLCVFSLTMRHVLVRNESRAVCSHDASQRAVT